MKKNIKIGLGAILVFALLLSATAAVSATPFETNLAIKEEIIGKGGITSSKVPVTNGSMGILATGKLWTANTDIWFSTFSGMHSDQYSRSRDNGIAWDIDTIAVHGRAWRDDTLQMDKTDTRSNSADGQLQEIVCTGWCGGRWRAQGDHTFEESGYQSWYPTTADSW